MGEGKSIALHAGGTKSKRIYSNARKLRARCETFRPKEAIPSRMLSPNLGPKAGPGRGADRCGGKPLFDLRELRARRRSRASAANHLLRPLLSFFIGK